MSTRDFPWGKGGRCVRLTTYHPCSAECQENPGPKPTWNPLGHLGLLRDDLYLYKDNYQDVNMVMKDRALSKVGKLAQQLSDSPEGPCSVELLY